MQTPYAIIQLAGKQFIVREQDEIVVDRQDEEATNMTVTDVLLVNNGKDVLIGQPLVKNASVELSVVSHGKGDKIRVAKYKAKSRYRKVHGHRQYQTTMTVSKITVK